MNTPIEWIKISTINRIVEIGDTTYRARRTGAGTDMQWRFYINDAGYGDHALVSKGSWADAQIKFAAWLEAQSAPVVSEPVDETSMVGREVPGKGTDVLTPMGRGFFHSVTCYGQWAVKHYVTGRIDILDPADVVIEDSVEGKAICLRGDDNTPTTIQPYHATPEQLLKIAALMWELKFTPDARHAFYTQHARFYSNRVDATYAQGVAMLNVLESLKKRICKDVEANSAAFFHSIELSRVLGFTNAHLWMEQQCVDISKRTGDYAKLTEYELNEFNKRCERYQVELAQFAD